MKKILIAGAAITLLATGCTNKEQERQIAQLSQERDSILAATYEKEQSIDEFITSFQQIEENLTKVTESQQSIARQTGDGPEMNKTAQERIQEEIAFISQLMEESKTQIAALDKKLRNSNSRVSKFQKMVASLNEQIALKDAEMVALNDQLIALNGQVNDLNQTVTNLQIKDSANTEFINRQTTEMHKGFIAVGPYKSLRDKQVIQSEGGFLGLGKEEKLATNLNSEAFTQVDITQLQTIPLQAKDAKLVTVHPAGSYELESDHKTASELKITDPDKFWSTSKYLVVMTTK